MTERRSQEPRYVPFGRIAVFYHLLEVGARRLLDIAKDNSTRPSVLNHDHRKHVESAFKWLRGS